MSEDRLEIIKENVYIRSEIAKISRLGIDTSLREELELLKEIERLNNIINLIKNNIDITMQIIKEQPTENDEWILERLNGIKNIDKELKEGKIDVKK